MPAPPRIIYHLIRASGPSGGIKVMLEHVQILRAAGFEAFAYTKNLEQRPSAFDIEVPYLSGAIGITPQDIIVRSETYSARDLEAAARGGLWQTVFAQNHYYCRHSLGAASNYAALGVADVFCASPRIKRFLEDNAIATDVPVVPCAIEARMDKDGGSVAGKVERIAAMPRKRPLEFGFIKHVFALRHPDLAEIPWIEIENMPHCEVLESLANSTMFLSLQRFEGFGLPALEAMAAGCVVAGFAGDGGWDYATTENGLWVEEDALEAAADALARVARGLRDRDPVIQAMIKAGKKTAAAYSAEARKKALIAYFEALLSRGPAKVRL